MTLQIVTFAMSALAIAILITSNWTRRTHEGPDEARLGLRGRRLVSADQICRQAAARLKLDVIYVERTNGIVRPITGVPWPMHLQVLDTMAADACLESGEPAGIGSGQHGASDWLFIPLNKDHQTVATVGVAGPHCRQR